MPEHLAPVPPDAAGRQQYSFSRLKRRDCTEQAKGPADEEGPSPPAVIDPLGLGTLVHAVLAELGQALAAGGPTAGGPTKPDLAALVRRHAWRHLPDVEDGLDEAIDLIERYLASPRWAAIARAVEVHVELEFLLPWADGGQKDGSYLQGFIDCLYRDAEGGWHLVDYKTNRVTTATVASVAAGYEMQMLVYALAAERILGTAPRELVLHFLRPGQEHATAWNAAARSRAVELVNAAIRAASP